jgi:hypothetical protein
MVEHELKCLPSFFQDVGEGFKTFEVRRDDRGGFSPRDTLRLREYAAGYGYTGMECVVEVLGVWKDLPGVMPGYVVMRIERRSPPRFADLK